MTQPIAGDPLDQLVQLSNQVGRDVRLVQPGGGNSSIKLESPDATGRMVRTLFVKGSGTDMRTIGRAGFSRLALDALAGLRGVASMSDREMMQFMAGSMLGREGPVPSVETPLHSILPHRVIVHTHDVATMRLTNLSTPLAERLVGEVFQGEIVYVPYVRPGFPLAQLVDRLADGIPPAARGLALAHHGLVVWGDTTEACGAVLSEMMRRAAGAAKSPRVSVAAPAAPAALATPSAMGAILPVIRGVLGANDRVVLHLDTSDEVREAIADVTPAVTARGVATPEHILRAGRRPLWLTLDPADDPDTMARHARQQLLDEREEYAAYHARHAPAGTAPITDWAKVVLVPGLGMVTAFKDRKGAMTANLCYRASLEAIRGAEALGGFEFIPEEEVFAFEHWPLERRKVDEEIERERASLLLARRVAVIIGGGSGIGEAAAHRFAETGAHVVVADVDQPRAESVATAVADRFPGRAVAVAVDVRSDASLDGLFHRTVEAFGGVDCLFYTAGRPPRFAPLVDLTREELQAQLEVHYLGAVRAMAGAARIMERQGLGGSIVVSVSKAALTPGRDAAAYGGSKAALLQALRVAAVELGPMGIRVNAINADQVETPLFLSFAAERARAKGVTLEAQLDQYRKRNVMGASLIPPEAVADLAVLLASDRFRFTTGDILTVDGGLPEAFPR